jgi:hypothetical protein
MVLLRKETISGNEIIEARGDCMNITMVNGMIVDAEYDEVVHKYKLRRDIDEYVKLGRVNDITNQGG